MSDRPEAIQARIDALRDLLQSPGWAIYRELITTEIAHDFEEHITRALDVPDEVLAMDRMRQVAAVRKAGMRWLKAPQEELSKLTAQANKASESAVTMSRRGSL